MCIYCIGPRALASAYTKIKTFNYDIRNNQRCLGLSENLDSIIGCMTRCMNVEMVGGLARSMICAVSGM